jgi:hypothetical protein
MTAKQGSGRTHSWRRYVHPLNVGLVWGFREVSKDLSLKDSMRWLIDQFQAEARITSGRYLSTGPQLILCNHRTPLTGVVMKATIDRDDTYFIGAPSWRILGERVIEKHLPVYMSQKWDPNPLELFRTYVLARFTEGLTRDQAREKNRRAVARSCQIVSSGAAVYMAPEGGTFFKNEWKSGLGHVIKGIENPDTQIQLARVAGGSRWDLIRFLNPHIFRPFLKRLRFTVDISEPIGLMKFQNKGKSAKEISLQVKAHAEKIFEWF